MRKYLRISLAVLLVLILIGGAVFWQASQPDIARYSTAELSGRVPVIATPRAESVPTMGIAEAVGWAKDEAPKAPAGLSVSRFADGLDHPRQMLVLPNGDVLVAETNSPPRNEGGITGMVMGRLMSKAGAGVPSANRISLLRDADGDGRAEVKVPLLTGLNSPYGMALVGGTLYVANTDALMAYPYSPGALKIDVKGTKIVDLPAQGSNRHWTKPMVASKDGTSLFIGVGSNSNIAEGGIEKEAKRALIMEVRPATKFVRAYAVGLRNPSGLAIHPVTGALWAAVNERDMLGSDLVPDYFTQVDVGADFGWPHYYWGGYIDERLDLPAVDKREYLTRPDYALGAHVAPLGVAFSTGQTLGSTWGSGAFVALHGSWNRMPVAGYNVVYVQFGPDGRPTDTLPLTVLDGFAAADGKTTKGRPADVQIAKDGALLVADDSGNVIWRVAKAVTN